MDAFNNFQEAIKGSPDFRSDPLRTDYLIPKMKAGDRFARDELIISTLGFIVSLAIAHCRRLHAWRDLEDLVQEANKRVAVGITRYDPRKSTLEGFIRFRARVAFIDYWYKASAISHSDYRRRLMRLIKRAFDELKKLLGREPSDEELAEHLDMDEKQLQEFIKQSAITIIEIDAQDDGRRVGQAIKLELLSNDKSPFQLAQLAEARVLAEECLGSKDAELLLSYIEYGVPYFQELYFRFKGKRISDANARKYKQRLIEKLEECVRRRTRLCA